MHTEMPCEYTVTHALNLTDGDMGVCMCVFALGLSSTTPASTGMEVEQLNCLDKSQNGVMQIKYRDDANEVERQECDEAALLQQWIELGVFDAIEKGYLKTLQFIIAKEGTPSSGGACVRVCTWSWLWRKGGPWPVNANESPTTRMVAHSQASLSRSNPTPSSTSTPKTGHACTDLSCAPRRR